MGQVTGLPNRVLGRGRPPSTERGTRPIIPQDRVNYFLGVFVDGIRRTLSVGSSRCGCGGREARICSRVRPSAFSKKYQRASNRMSFRVIRLLSGGRLFLRASLIQ